MSIIKGRMRLFYVSSVIASFTSLGFLGTRYNTFEKVGQTNDKLSLASDEVTPLSQVGEGERNIIEEIIEVPDWDEVIKKEKEKQEKQNQVKSVANTTVTKSVVTKKTVASSVKYTPAVYDSVTGNAIVEYAKRYLGLRYVYAGRSLATGTDCSGFTSLIYKEFGVSLPKTVSGQYNRGTYVSKSNLQKGDIVFYSGGGSYPTHVAMYIGGGMVIHESNPRDGVKISPVNMMRYISARRVINANATKIVEQKIEEQKKQEEANKEQTITTDDTLITSDVSNLNQENVNTQNKIESKDTVIETVVDKTSESNQEIMDEKKDETTEVVSTKEEQKNEITEKASAKEEKKEEPIKQEIVQEEQKVDTPVQEVKEEKESTVKVETPKEEIIPATDKSQTIESEDEVGQN